MAFNLFGMGAGFLSGAVGMMDAKNKADSIRSQAQFNARQSEFNARMMEYQKDDIKRQSESAIFQRHRKTKQTVGSQRAALAAQGIDVEGDIGQSLADDEYQYGLEDTQAIANNAWKQSFGIEVNQFDLRMKAKQTRLKGEYDANDTLATGGINAVKSVSGGFGF